MKAAPALVFENDDLLGGGVDIEDILQAGHVPYLRANAACSEFPATRSTYPGVVGTPKTSHLMDGVTITCTSLDGMPLIPVSWEQGYLHFSIEEMNHIEQFYRQRDYLLRLEKPAPVPTHEGKE